MKFLHVTFHFEYTDQIEKILDEQGVENYVRISMIEAKDCDGKHFGTQVYPGSSSMVQAQVEDGKIDGLMQGLREFRDQKKSRHHLQAVVLPVEQTL